MAGDSFSRVAIGILGEVTKQKRITELGNVNEVTPRTIGKKAGSVSKKIKTITNSDTPYSVDIGEHTIFVDTSSGVVTVNLPAAATAYASGFLWGAEYRVIIKDATNTTTVQVTGGATNINGTTSRSLTVQYDVETYQSDGTQYWIVGN